MLKRSTLLNFFWANFISLFSTESQIFKSKFEGWDDVMAVDFTRTAESVIRRGVDLRKILEKDQIKTDLTALFMPRQQPMPSEEAVSVSLTCCFSFRQDDRDMTLRMRHRFFNIKRVFTFIMVSSMNVFALR